MLLNIYITTIVITIICFIGAEYASRRECKIRYTKDQLKYVKENYKEKDNPVTKVLIFVFPLVNITFALIWSLGYKTVCNELFKMFDKVLITYTEPGEGDNGNGR